MGKSNAAQQIVVPPPAASQARAVADIPADFDEQLYLTLNPDVADAVAKGSIPSGVWHWSHHGAAEERQGKRPSVTSEAFYQPLQCNPGELPSTEQLQAFDAERYLALNPDVRNAIGDGAEAALDHWVKFGRFEGRPVAESNRFRGRGADPVRLMKRPFGVNFFAPFSARSGLGTAARGYLRALRATDIPVHLVNIDLTVRHLRITARDHEVAPPYRINLIQVNADTISRFLAQFRPGWFDDAYTIAIWAWEMNVLRPDWYQAFSAVDEIWTLSQFNTEAVRAISPVPVRTMNPVVVPAPTVVLDRAYFGLPAGFLFLTLLDVTSSLARKNPELAVDAFVAAFGDRTDVHLVLKFHSSQRDLAALQRLLRRVRHVKNIIIRSDLMRDDELRSLQACADCLISMHRAEGFGLNIAEFMLTGKPVIVTGYSGNMDFTDPDNSYIVPYTLEQVTEASGPYLPGYLWASPDREALATQMHRVVDAPDHGCAIGLRGAATVRDRFSAVSVGHNIKARFTELGLEQTLPPFMEYFGRSATLAAPPADILRPLQEPAELAAHPTLSVLVAVENISPRILRANLESVRAQSYRRWELCICADAGASAETREVLQAYQGTDPRIRIKYLPQHGGISAAVNAAATLATGAWLVLLGVTDELASDDLAEIAGRVSRDPSIDALYADPVRSTKNRENAPDRSGVLFHQPAWSPEYVESMMYTGDPLIIRTSLFLRLGGLRAAYDGAQNWDLMLRVSRETDAIRGIPMVLQHAGPGPGTSLPDSGASEIGARVLRDHVAAKYGDVGTVVEPAGRSGQYRIRHAIQGAPQVTLLIATNNEIVAGTGRPPSWTIENVVQSIRERTRYTNYRIVVVDSGDTPPRQRKWLNNTGIETRSYAGEGSNPSQKVNSALRHLHTEHVVVMSDDIEVVNDDWLSALLEFSQMADTGACVGRITETDPTRDQGGIVLHFDANLARADDVPDARDYVRNVADFTGLSGACLATRRAVLNEVGGWDPRLTTGLKDIDLFLRMQSQGYRVVYTPACRLRRLRNGNATAEAENANEQIFFRSRWDAARDARLVPHVA